MTTVRRALVLSLAGRYVQIALALLSNVILARLLTPEQIGIYSVSLAAIGIAQVLRDFGIGSFLIQQKDLNEAHIRTAFGLSLMLGGSLFFVMFFAAPWIGHFYSEPRLVQTLRISSLNFIVLPFCTISLALLRREMLFDRLIIVALSATTVGISVTLSLAYLGFGPNSMAIGGVMGNVTTGVGAWLAAGRRRLLLPSLSQWRPLLSFGGQTALSNVVTTVAMDINDLAIGRILGFAPVAMISRAQGLMNLFHRDLMSAVRSVAYPAFAKAHREGESLEARYVSSVGAVTVFAWPFYGFAALYSLELLRLLFGPQWDEAAGLVPLFCLAGAFAATSNLAFNAVTAVGRIDLVTRAELAFQPSRAALIVAVALIFQSLLACAAAYLVAFIIHTPLVYWVKGRCIPNDWRALASQLGASAKVTLVTLAVPLVIAWCAGWYRVEPMGILALISSAATAAVAWLAAVIVFQHPISADPLFKRLVFKWIRSS